MWTEWEIHGSGNPLAFNDVASSSRHEQFTQAKMQTCYGDCRYEMDINGNLRYVGGGDLKTIAFAKVTCPNGGPWNDHYQRYTCMANTAVVSDSPYRTYCWTNGLGIVYAADGAVEFKAERNSRVYGC